MNHLTLIATTRRTLIAVVALTLVACATTPAPVTVADTLASQPALTTFNSLVTQAGLTAALKADGPFTVFAPTNEAFKAVPAGTMDDWAKNPEKLKAVLTYHVITGKTMAAEVKNSNANTMNGAHLALSKAGDFVTVDSAAVLTPDLAASNGVVHTIDTVLMPPKK